MIEITVWKMYEVTNNVTEVHEVDEVSFGWNQLKYENSSVVGLWNKVSENTKL